MGIVAVRGVDLYYEHYQGGSPRVLWISGTGADLRQNPLRGKGPLERQNDVLMYDQRGLGRSAKPDQPYSMADYADDAAALMDTIGWSSAHVLGVSFGGMVAQHLALRHPERVDKLVLACTSSGGAGGASGDLLELSSLPPDEALKARLQLMDSRNDFSVDPPRYAPKLAPIAERMSQPPLNSDDPDASIGARRQLEARSGHNTWDRLGEITASTLVIGGRYDRQAPPENLRNLAAAIPSARVELFDGGHFFLLQDPAAWDAINAFVAHG